MENEIKAPDADEYAHHYEQYIKKVREHKLIDLLKKGAEDIIEMLSTVAEEKLDYRYLEGKWSIKELIVHLMDAERIFMYRALRFSRNDDTPLQGFDENEYIPESGAELRSRESLLSEYIAIRKATIEFFKNITLAMSERRGIANGKEISVRALGYIIPGHEQHHLEVIKEKYL